MSPTIASTVQAAAAVIAAMEPPSTAVIEWFQLLGGTAGLVLLFGMLVQLGRLLQKWQHHREDEEKEWHWNRRDHKTIFAYLDGLFDKLSIDRGEVNEMRREAGIEDSGSKRRKHGR